MSVHPVRLASVEDVKSLSDLEQRCFQSDRISARSFRYFVKKSSAQLWVIGQPVYAYGLVLFHRGTSLARIYSLAVDQSHRGEGWGKVLMDQLEEAAKDHGALFIRLEVADDNIAAQKLYAQRGYLPIRRLRHYYEDGHDGIRLEKRLQIARDIPKNLPYYEQTTDFTCGPASLLMAMKQLNNDLPFNQLTELTIWREATTIFMTTGHGGTSPYGLALAAQARGFNARLWVSNRDAPFLDSVRSADKKSVIELIHRDFLARTEASGIPIQAFDGGVDDIRHALEAGEKIILLISTYRLNRCKGPHWIWLVSIDDDYVYFNDPDVDYDSWKGAVDSVFVPVPLADFEKMMRYGRNQYRAAILISNNQH